MGTRSLPSDSGERQRAAGEIPPKGEYRGKGGLRSGTGQGQEPPGLGGCKSQPDPFQPGIGSFFLRGVVYLQPQISLRCQEQIDVHF
jgi:hypothetical protein